MSWLNLRAPGVRAGANSRSVRSAASQVAGPPRSLDSRARPPCWGPGSCAHAEATSPMWTCVKNCSTASVAALRETSSSLLTVPALPHPVQSRSTVSNSGWCTRRAYLGGCATLLGQQDAVHLDDPGAVADLADTCASGVMAAQKLHRVVRALGGHSADEADAHVEDLPQLGARDFAEAADQLAHRWDGQRRVD